MKTLNVMSLDFTYKAAIRGYQSAIIKRVWNGIGSLELVISEEIPNASLISENDIIWFDHEYHKAFIIEHIETELSGSVMTYRITANHINVLLHDYITIPPSGEDTDARTGSREQVVRYWVEENCIDPDNPARVQYPLVLSETGGFGGTITEQSRFATLSEEITRVLLPDDLGWRVDLDLEHSRFVFKVLDGVNRTSVQSENNRILFGLRYGNIAGFRKVKDVISAKTVAYIGGQGDGSTRLVVELDNAAGGRRKELFVDAQDIGTINELAERGYQALSDAAAVNSFEFEALSRQFQYEADYDLGDFVTVVIDKDTFQHLQIRELREIYEQGNISVKPVFGTPERTLGRTVVGVAKQLSSLTASSTKIDDNKVSPASTWSSEQIKNRASAPVGAILAIATSNIPEGWFECNGAAVSRTQYAELFASIGTTYGAGNGSTTFNLPNLKGRTLVGLDSSQTEFASLGQTGGEKSHTLTVAELPPHTHDIKIDSDTTPDGGTGATASEDTHNVTLADGALSTGGGEAHNNLQPYMALKWIIKY
ncbi:Gp37-like protein [Gudongella oleilytica]|uniref:Gp37-like protein n=1 Tax=Gudongella oleilytica TaxID=1582259 RepID=UPI000FF886A4|nr:tail fiber protein [Gudongella oleilytica]